MTSTAQHREPAGGDQPVRVIARGESTEVTGLTATQVDAALQWWVACGGLTQGSSPAQRRALLRDAERTRIDPARPADATIAQAGRIAAHRAATLAGGHLDFTALARLRGIQQSSARTWVARQRARGRIFTVSRGGTTLIPSFQLDADGEPRAELAPLLAELTSAGAGQWEIWTWLTSPTGLLSDEVPERVAVTDPERALAAARRFAAASAQFGSAA